MRRVSRPRQSPLPIRTTSFRPAPQTVPLPAEQPVLLPRSIRRRTSASPVTSVTSITLTTNVTDDSIALTLPVPPSVNHQYATVNGRRLLSARGRAYKELVGQQILLALAQSSNHGTLRRTLSRASLALSIRFFFASALRRDTDGGLKIAQDALCEGLGLNDNRVIETHLYKYQDRDNPRMEILLSVVPPATPGSPFPAPPPTSRAAVTTPHKDIPTR